MKLEDLKVESFITSLQADKINAGLQNAQEGAEGINWLEPLGTSRSSCPKDFIGPPHCFGSDSWHPCLC